MLRDDRRRGLGDLLKIFDALTTEAKKCTYETGVIESAAQEWLRCNLNLAYPMIIKVGRGGIPSRE